MSLRYLNNIDEQKEKEKREYNLIFHNIPEATSEDNEERKEFDNKKVKVILDYLDVDDDPQVDLKPVRLGKKLPNNKPRLLKVSMASVHNKRRVLTVAKSLRNRKFNLKN